MGKKRKVCATSTLHDPLDGSPSKKFIHGSKLRNELKADILGRVGKRWKKFDKNICMKCIAMVTDGAGIQSKKTQRKPVKSTIKVPKQRTKRLKGDLKHQFRPCYGKEQHNDQTAEYVPHETVINIDISQNVVTQSDIPDSHDSTTTQPTEPINQALEAGLMERSSSEIRGHVDQNPQITLCLRTLPEDLRTLSLEIRQQLAYHLAGVERDNIRADTVNLTQTTDYRSLPSLTDICKNGYQQGRNTVLLNFLQGLRDKPKSGSPINATQTEPMIINETSKIYKLAKVAEACMSLTSPISVLPIHFREALLLYTSTRSRAALALMSATAPHGCYQTIRKWLDELANNQEKGILLLDKGDSVCMFDNNQVIRRRWNIQVDNKVGCSIITMVMFLEINRKGTLEFQESLKPINWMWHNLDDEQKEKLKLGPQLEIHRDTHYRKHFYPWLSIIIEQVVQEQTLAGSKCVDDIDKEIQAKKNKPSKQCPKCGQGVTKYIRKCPSCDEKIPPLQKQMQYIEPCLSRKRKSEDGGLFRAVIKKKDDSTVKIIFQNTEEEEKRPEYAHLQEHHQEHPPEATMGRPIYLNPCSYEAVGDVFRQIAKQAGIRGYGSGTREWLVIICDGLPYVLGYQLIERSWLCNLCEASVHGEDELMAHKKIHGGVGSFRKEFGWVLLQPGPGHVEMNMLKTFVKFAWPIFWEDMVEIFNFRSENAKRTAKNVSDHHKGWMLARIAREALAKELVLPYVRQRLKEGRQDMSVVDYLNYVQKEQPGTANYALMFNLTFTILGSIFMYREGVRCGDVSMMEAGKKMFSRMWCAQNHPMYRQLSANDSIMSACMPPSVSQFVNQTKSFNLDGHPYTGQGGDFKLEEWNRAVQQWIPAIPQKKDWDNTCANVPLLSKLKENTLSDAKIKDPKDRRSKASPDIKTQVSALRVGIREHNFVPNVSADKDEEMPLTSYSGQLLNPDLVSFAKDACRKEQIFLNNFILHKETGCSLKRSTIPYKEAPIFVTQQEKAEFHNIRNKSIADCTAIINAKIATIANDKMRQEFQEVFDHEIVAKRVAKTEYLEFHDMLEDFLDSFVADEATIDATDDII